MSSGTRLCVVLLDLLAKEVDGDETDQVVDVFEIGFVGSLVPGAFGMRNRVN